jgi:hypothetical protein
MVRKGPEVVQEDVWYGGAYESCTNHNGMSIVFEVMCLREKTTEVWSYVEGLDGHI